MPLDLLLAHGYFLSLDAAEQRVMRPHPPLGLLYLSSHLKRRGFVVGVFDATFRSIAEFTATLERERPPVVGIAVNLMTKRNALRHDRDCETSRRQGGDRRSRSAASRGVVPRRRRRRGRHRRRRADARRADRWRSGRPGRTCRPSTASCSRVKTARPRARRRARSCPISTTSRIRIARRSICPGISVPGASATAVGTVSLDHRPRLSVHLHLVQSIRVRRNASPPFGRQCRRRSRGDRRSLPPRAVVVRGRCVRDPSHVDDFVRARARAPPHSIAVRVHLARRTHRRRRRRGAGESRLLPGLDWFRERLTAHPRCDEA